VEQCAPVPAKGRHRHTTSGLRLFEPLRKPAHGAAHAGFDTGTALDAGQPLGLDERRQRHGIISLDRGVHRTPGRSSLAKSRWALIDEFTEIESGKRNDRLELVKALAAWQKAESQARYCQARPPVPQFGIHSDPDGFRRGVRGGR
jgi:hypothetical protein